MEFEGVGRGGPRSGVVEMYDFLGGAAFFLRGDAFFDGESGVTCMESSASNVSVGSMPAGRLVFAFREPIRDVSAIEVVVLRFGELLLEIRAGAGVKSSSSSSAFLVFKDVVSISSSESSTINLRLDAVRRDGRVGDSDAMI